MSSDHRDRRSIRFHFASMINFYSIVGSVETLGERGFIFEGIQRWPVINLVTLIHGYSYLISLKLLRSFQRTQVSLSMLLEKPDITYPSRNT